MSGYNSYLTHYTILFNNDKTSFFRSKWMFNNAFSLAMPSGAFKAGNILRLSFWRQKTAIPRKTNEYCFELKVFFLSNFLLPCCWMTYCTVQTKWKQMGERWMNCISRAQWNASLQKIKWYCRAMAYSRKLRLNSIKEQVPLSKPDCAKWENKMCNVTIIHYLTASFK